jgi:nucleoside-diphosphate-sugar epimerase
MILITGDAGFIGSYIVASLQARGCTLRGLDHAPGAETHQRYDRRVADIADEHAVISAMHGIDTVIHLAAEHKDSGIHSEDYFRVNVGGTRTILEAMSETGVKKLVFFSSVAVYGNADFPSEETQPAPSNAYGHSKLEAEQVISQWIAKDASRQAVIIRPTVVFGPRNRANIFKLIKYVCDKNFIWVGKGENVKSVAYVENIAEATMFLMDRLRPGVDIYNYVDEPQMTTRQIVSLIAAKAGVPAPGFSLPLGIAVPAAKVLDVVATLTGRDFAISTNRLKKFNTSTRFQSGKLRSAGFLPPFTIEEGIGKNVRWYKDQMQIVNEKIVTTLEE